jgi:hypothetical protein
LITPVTPYAGIRARDRAIAAITGITLHQTGVVLGEKAQRWSTVPVHFGIPRSGQLFQMHDVAKVVAHGNRFNANDVGIEIDGHFEGIEAKSWTYWRPAQEPNRLPLVPSAEQIASARQCVRTICSEVARRGGRIQFIHAHRQSSNQRQSDPGSRIWQEVGVWAQHELGLSDGGDGFKVGTGMAIPKAWDPKRTANY